MRNNFLRLCATLVLLFQFALQAAAQTTGSSEPEMADTLRQSGKIYVVIAVIVIIISGLVLYLFSLDRKMSKLEKEVNR